ncbi:MAG: PAS domain S-box protein, partial [Atribacterota bacterium]|nr:PAS domain S-box protein [Atribacterota bacterium]
MMNILPFLHFFTFLVYISLIFFILWKDAKSLLNRVCAAFLACFALWSFGLIFLYIPDTLKDTAVLFNKIASMGWIGFAGFFLWFALIFAEKKKILKTKFFYAVLFSPPLLFIYTQWSDLLTADYIQHPWGWGKLWADSIWTYLFYFYYISFTLIGLFLIYFFGKKTKKLIKKKQAMLMFTAALLSLILATLIEVILPLLNIFTIPSLGNIVTLIWAGGLVYAIVKYEFMTITPATAAENIISTMADSLILLGREGRIDIANESLLNLSGYRRDELTGKSVEIFFPEKDFKNTLLEKAGRKATIRNYELDFKTKTGENVPVLFSSSTINDDGGWIAGIVCIIKDVTEQKENEIKIEYEQSLLHAILDNTSDSIYFKDKETRFVRVNKTKALHSGSIPEEMIGKTDFDYFSPQIAKKSFQDDIKVIKTGKPIIGKVEEIIRLNNTT